jgi:predicted phage-related endonuclease
MNIPVIQYKTDHQEAYLLYQVGKISCIVMMPIEMTFGLQILEFGISEALELNCLKTLEYCIHDQSTDDIIETYVFNFQHCTGNFFFCFGN